VSFKAPRFSAAANASEGRTLAGSTAVIVVIAGSVSSPTTRARVSITPHATIAESTHMETRKVSSTVFTPER
jgi:hypothetical protein